MARELRHIQSVFNSGEISPRLFARIDLKRYETGCALLQNFFVLPLGGVIRRAGTTFVKPVKDSARKTRLIPFEIGTTDAFIVEVGGDATVGYLRFYKNGARLENPPGTPVEVATPYREVDLPDLKWVQAADLLYLIHPLYPVRRLRNTGTFTFDFVAVGFTDGPYLPPNPFTARTLTLSGGPPWTNGSTLTMTAVGHSPFNVQHLDSFWRLKDPASSATIWVGVTGFTSATVVTVVTKKDVPAGLQNVATSEWREGAFSTFRGFPRTAGFFEERLVFGGVAAVPSTLFGSVSGNYEDMTPGTADDDAFEYVISANGVQVIQWIVGGSRLLVGTAATEFSVRGGGSKQITPTSVLVQEETNHGSNGTAPQKFGLGLFFVQRAGRKLHELAFDDTAAAFLAPDALLTADHLTRKATIVELSYALEPLPIVWAVLSDGTLLSLVFDKQEQIAGWSRHVTDGKFESIARIPHPTAGRDQMWVIVNRTVLGATWRYIEFIEDAAGSFYNQLGVDSGLAFSGVGLTSLTGLSHLEGKTVQIVGDGAVYPEKVVTAGAVSVDPPVNSAEVGLKYISQLKTLRPEIAALGSLQDSKKARPRLFVRVEETLGLKINGTAMPFRSSSDLMGQPPPIFSGDVEANLLGWSADPTLDLQQDLPLPATILAVHGVLNVGD